MTKQRSVLTLASALVVFLGAGCGRVGVLDRPSDAYEHPPLDEMSTAYLVPSRHGDALTHELRQRGWFCVDARRNSSASQTWCRLRTPAPQGDEITTVQLILDPAGQLRYAEINLESDSSVDQIAEGRFQQVLAQSLLTQWPDDTEAVTRALDGESERQRELSERGEYYSPPAQGWQTSHAVYAMPSPSRLTVTPLLGGEPAWPFGADHYATTMTAALPGLRAGGFTCHYPPQTSCNRPDANQAVHVSVHGDQIVTATVRIGSLVRHGHQRATLTDQGFPSGLPFLTDRVEPAVRARL